MSSESASSPTPDESSSARSLRTNPPRRDRSAGGVAYRRAPAGDEFEIALIATHGGKRWQLPKGSREINESAEETAIREVQEEVGLLTQPQAFLRRVEYWYWDTHRKQTPELVHKTVDFYLLRVVGGKLSDASYEVDGVGWFTFEAALEALTFQGESEVTRQACEALRYPDLRAE